MTVHLGSGADIIRNLLQFVGHPFVTARRLGPWLGKRSCVPLLLFCPARLLFGLANQNRHVSVGDGDFCSGICSHHRDTCAELACKRLHYARAET
jgi:hypothetical protein